MEALSEASSSSAANFIISTQLKLTPTQFGEKLPEVDPSGCMQIDDSAPDTISVSSECHVDALEQRVHEREDKVQIKVLAKTVLGSLQKEENEKVNAG